MVSMIVSARGGSWHHDADRREKQMKSEAISVWFKMIAITGFTVATFFLLGAGLDSQLAQLNHQAQTGNLTLPPWSRWVCSNLVGESNITEGSITFFLMCPWLLFVGYVLALPRLWSDPTKMLVHFLGTFFLVLMASLFLFGVFNAACRLPYASIVSLWIEEHPPKPMMRFSSIAFWTCAAVGVAWPLALRLKARGNSRLPSDGAGAAGTGAVGTEKLGHESKRGRV